MFQPDLRLRANRAFTLGSFSPGNPLPVFGSKDRLLTEHSNALPASEHGPGFSLVLPTKRSKREIPA